MHGSTSFPLTCPQESARASPQMFHKKYDSQQRTVSASTQDALSEHLPPYMMNPLRFSPKLALTLSAICFLYLPTTTAAMDFSTMWILSDVTTHAPQVAVQEPSSWGVFDFLMMLGALALLLYGMQRMSEGFQQAAGKKLRHLMGSMTSNPFKGMLAGLGITTLIQSSSITTVMAVSFVNAGILSLKQAASVLMGANIGTTMTAWIVDTFGFKVNIEPYTLVFIAVAFPLLFARSSKVKGWGTAIMGFAFLFLGLSSLADALPTPGPDSTFVQFFINLSNLPVLGLILSVLLGALLTVVIQSSSVTIALTMTLTVSGVIPFTVAAAMVLGENIGTTITAELAATVGNANAKRTARFHSIFNCLGVTWALIFFPILMKGVVFFTEIIAGGSPLSTETSVYASTGLAVLHTLFNVTNVAIFIGFIPQLIKLVEKTVPIPDEEKEQYHLEYIGSLHELGPDLSILEVKKELAKFGRVTSRMSGFARELMTTDVSKTKHELLERIQKYESITDRVEVEIANFLNQIASQNPSRELAMRFHGMSRVASNLERIGDLFYQVSKILEKKDEEDISFSPLQQQRLIEMFDLIDEALIVMQENQVKNFDDVTIEKAQDLEEQINAKRDAIRREHYENAQENRSDSLEGDLLYNNMFSSLERIGDHIINVTEGVLGKV